METNPDRGQRSPWQIISRRIQSNDGGTVAIMDIINENIFSTISSIYFVLSLIYNWTDIFVSILFWEVLINVKTATVQMQIKSISTYTSLLIMVQPEVSFKWVNVRAKKPFSKPATMIGRVLKRLQNHMDHTCWCDASPVQMYWSPCSRAERKICPACLKLKISATVVTEISSEDIKTMWKEYIL